jgi:hypothetical protein
VRRNRLRSCVLQVVGTKLFVQRQNNISLGLAGGLVKGASRSRKDKGRTGKSEVKAAAMRDLQGEIFCVVSDVYVVVWKPSSQIPHKLLL